MTNTHRGWHVNITCEQGTHGQPNKWSVAIYDDKHELVLMAEHGSDADAAYEDYYDKVERYAPQRRLEAAKERGQRYDKVRSMDCLDDNTIYWEGDLW